MLQCRADAFEHRKEKGERKYNELLTVAIISVGDAVVRNTDQLNVRHPFLPDQKLAQRLKMRGDRALSVDKEFYP